MAKNLVIVESPAKVNSIKKFLGSNYTVKASMGHVRDLPKSQMGIDFENGCEPKYITIRGKGDLLADLRKSAKSASTIFLATDPDREGEAISWHLAVALKQDEKKFKRVSFNEITRDAVKNAIKNPRQIDMNLVDAQQARRVIDRLVGYEISPLLWSKVKRGLSAGRVQSVAVKIIADREEEIKNFIPEEYWSLDALFGVPGSSRALKASFYGKEKKLALNNEDMVKEVISGIRESRCVVSNVKNSERVKKQPLPFTTSTLQQEASKHLNFGTAKTMRIAQQLYEGLEIKGQGSVGLITYLRTDSTRIADSAKEAAEAYIAEKYGKEYIGGVVRAGNKNGNVQDAHEAIRPTDIRRTPAVVKDSLTREQYRLYSLIWERFAASQMAPAVYATSQVKISAGEYYFTASSSKLSFAGFTAVYKADDEKNSVLPVIPEKGMVLELNDLIPEQHFTQPPAHYTEAALVKTLEELGIGRPSTYAPTISTIIARKYVIKEQKNLYLTELGEVVNEIMLDYFSPIVNESFTANLESLFDAVAEGRMNWKTIVENFYPDIENLVKQAGESLEKITIADEVTQEICEECGANMVIKYGPYGKFLACPNFPACRNTKQYFEKIGVSCPKCGSEIARKRSKKGRTYYGCIKSPECDFMSWLKPVDTKCPKCGGYMVEKGRNIVCANDKCGYAQKKQADNNQ